MLASPVNHLGISMEKVSFGEIIFHFFVLGILVLAVGTLAFFTYKLSEAITSILA